MAQQELRPSWCGSLATNPRIVWNRAWGVYEPVARAYCSHECRDAGHRVGRHCKWEPLIQCFTVNTSALADLDKERSEGRAERNRLARKVNALLGRLQDERANTNHAECSVRTLESAIVGLKVERGGLATENELLRNTLDDLGQKNDALTMEKAKLVGKLIEQRQREDENDYLRSLAADKREGNTRELYTRIYNLDLAVQNLTDFVFSVLDQYAESQQQLASNR